MKRLLGITAISFVVVLAVTAAGHYTFDRPIAVFFAGLPLDSPFVIFFQIITHLGVSTWYLVGSGILFIYFYYASAKVFLARQTMYFFCSIAVSGLAVNVIKWLMGRWRPRAFLYEGLYGFEFFGHGYDQTSFPSGHAATICSLAVALFFIAPRLRWLWITLAVLVCLSRVVIWAHFPSDVLMGAYVGIFSAILLRKSRPFQNNVAGVKSI